MSAQRPLLAIVGPTASGKTRMAVDVAAALSFPIEVLSCDSMAVYRGLDIVSAKPAADDRRALPHHLVDLVDPSQDFTAAEYGATAARTMREVRERGRVPVLVGGSGLWFRAAVDALEFAPTDPALRAALELQEPAALWRRLMAADPDAATRIDPGNTRRVVRAVEILELSGRPPTELRTSWERRAEVVAAGLTWNREDLYRRVEQRVDDMISSGLLDEVRAARRHGLGRTASQAVGVKEVLAHLDGEASLEDTRTLIVRATKRFIRRQYSWFRADPRVRWIDLSVLGWDGGRAAVRELLEA